MPCREQMVGKRSVIISNHQTCIKEKPSCHFCFVLFSPTSGSWSIMLFPLEGICGMCSSFWGCPQIQNCVVYIWGLRLWPRACNRLQMRVTFMWLSLLVQKENSQLLWSTLTKVSQGMWLMRHFCFLWNIC